MGEAKRRKALDPNYGRQPNFMVAALAHICGPKDYRRYFNFCIDASTDRKGDLLAYDVLSAVIDSGGEEKPVEDLIVERLNSFGSEVDEEMLVRSIQRVAEFMKSEAFRSISVIKNMNIEDITERFMKSFWSDFWRKYAYIQG